MKNINKRYKVQKTKYIQFKTLQDQNNTIKKAKTKSIFERYNNQLKSRSTYSLNKYKTISNEKENQKLILPYTSSNGNIIHNENLFSGSENSYSSTYNSSSRTKLFSENTIRHHPLLSNNNISMYKKYNSNISRNFINKINNHTISPQTTRDHFFLRKKSPNIENLKKSNINLINIKNNININNQDLVDKNYFSSRNINNNINNGPVKLLSMNEDTLKNVFSTSSINSNSSLNQNSISTNKANSMEYLTIINNKDNNSNLNVYISPNRKRFKNKRAHTFELSFSRYTNPMKKRSHDFTNIQRDYIPIFKRRKAHIKKKKTNIIPSHKFSKQLSKIPENTNNDNNNKIKIRTVNSVRHEKHSSTLEFSIDNEKYSINKRKSCEITLKDNSLIKDNEDSKNENNQINSGSLSEEENSLSKDEYFIDRNNKKENTIMTQNRNNIIDFKVKTIKKSKKILFFEEEIKDKFNEINNNCVNIKNNKVDNILFILYKYIEQNEENLNIKTFSHHIIDDKNTKKIKDETFNSMILKNVQFFSYKMHKKKDKIKFETTVRKININFPGEFLFVKYFNVNLIYHIKDNYLIHDFNEIMNTNNETLIRNFTPNKLLLRRRNNISKKENIFLKRIIPKIKNLPVHDFYYILNFHQKDYEYFIVPDTSSVKLEDVKLRLSAKIISSNMLKNKNRRKSLQTLKFSISKDDKLKNIDKNLLKQSLRKNNYFRRLKTIIRPNKKIETFKLKDSYNDIQTKLIEKNYISSVNKLQMISKANELKYQIFQSLKTHIDEIIFYIKDRNYPGFIQTFEKYKISPDSKDINGDSLLSIAVQSNSFQIVNYLLNAGATPNTKNKNNNTPLHFALTFHNYEIADMLIQRGADEKAINKLGITPWQCVDNGNSII